MLNEDDCAALDFLGIQTLQIVMQWALQTPDQMKHMLDTNALFWLLWDPGYGEPEGEQLLAFG